MLDSGILLLNCTLIATLSSLHTKWSPGHQMVLVGDVSSLILCSQLPKTASLLSSSPTVSRIQGRITNCHLNSALSHEPHPRSVQVNFYFPTLSTAHGRNRTAKTHAHTPLHHTWPIVGVVLCSLTLHLFLFRGLSEWRSWYVVSILNESGVTWTLLPCRNHICLTRPQKQA